MLRIEEVLQSIQNAFPALIVVDAGFFGRQLLMSQEHLRPAIGIRKFHSDDARSIFPSVIIIVFPGENDFLSWNDLAILAADRLFFAITIDQVPTELSARFRFSDDFTRPNPLRTEPLLQLRWISPGSINLSTRRVDDAFDLQRRLRAALLVTIFLSLASQRIP
jgi:hypothetical protein